MTVTDSNVTEMQDIFASKLADSNEVLGLMMQACEEYDKIYSAGAFKALPMIDKLLFIYRYAMINGYVCALTDVQTVQRLEAEQMQGGR